MKKLLITRNHANAMLPTKGSAKAAGYDLYSTESYVLKPGERKLFNTGLNMAIPQGMYGRIAPRSGLAFKSGIDVLAGVIDEDYRGDVGVILINLGSEDFSISSRDRIAQIIFEFYNDVSIEEVATRSNTNEFLGKTERGSGGFGSTDNQVVKKEHSSHKKSDFSLKGTTTVRKFWTDYTGQSITDPRLTQYESHLSNFPGEIYEYEENDFKGLCVMDYSGTLLIKIPLVKI